MPETRRSRIGGWQIACGSVPKHWRYHEEMSKLANDALYFCRDRMAKSKHKGLDNKGKPIVLKVYVGYRSYRYVGKNYTRVGVICLNEKRDAHKVMATLAHEVAHMGYSAHGPRHEELTKKIDDYFLSQGGLEKVKCVVS